MKRAPAVDRAPSGPPRPFRRRTFRTVALLFSALAGCTGDGAPVVPDPSPDCPRFDGGRAVGRVVEAGIDEASGLVASRVRPGLWWTHNDSGDRARVFALDGAGRLLGIVDLPGVEAVDWEDIAIGPGPEKSSWLTVGDIGDNPAARQAIRLHRFPEPVAGDPAEPAVFTAPDPVETWTVRYEDGAHDAETLLVDPTTGETFVVTKTREAPAGLYRIEIPPPGERPGGEATARRVGEVDLAVATGGDVSPDGRAVLIRGYREALLWSRRDGEELTAAFARSACQVPLRDEPQGESIAWSADGASYATLGERVEQPLWSFTRIGGTERRDPAGSGSASAP